MALILPLGLPLITMEELAKEIHPITSLGIVKTFCSQNVVHKLPVHVHCNKRFLNIKLNHHSNLLGSQIIVNQLIGDQGSINDLIVGHKSKLVFGDILRKHFVMPL